MISDPETTWVRSYNVQSQQSTGTTKATSYSIVLVVVGPLLALTDDCDTMAQLNEAVAKTRINLQVLRA